MSSKKIKFGDKEVDKKEFYSSKQAETNGKLMIKHINIYAGI